MIDESARAGLQAVTLTGAVSGNMTSNMPQPNVSGAAVQKFSDYSHLFSLGVSEQSSRAELIAHRAEKRRAEEMQRCRTCEASMLEITVGH